MKKVSLKKGRSYSGHGVNIVRGETISVEDDVAAVLLESGYFEIEEFNGDPLLPGDLQEPPTEDNQLEMEDLINNALVPESENPRGDDASNRGDDKMNDGSESPQGGDSDAGDAGDAKPVSKMKKEELIAYAEKKEYDISNCQTVEEMKNLIKELDAAIGQ